MFSCIYFITLLQIFHIIFTFCVWWNKFLLNLKNKSQKSKLIFKNSGNKNLFKIGQKRSLQHNILHSFCCVFVLWNLFCNNQLFICDVIVIIRKSSTGNELWVFIVWGWLSICDVIIFNICHKLYINCLWALSSKKKVSVGNLNSLNAH